MSYDTYVHVFELPSLLNIGCSYDLILAQTIVRLLQVILLLTLFLKINLDLVPNIHINLTSCKDQLVSKEA